MKHIMLLLALLLVQCLSAQNGLKGIWQIDVMVGLEETNEYKLTRPTGKYCDYGYSLNLDEKGKFVSVYSAPCLNDCFTTNTGRYEILDESHITFFLDTVLVYGFCQRQELYPKKNLGVFQIVKEEDGLRLIKSNNDIEIDKLNAEYSAILTEFASSHDNIYSNNYLVQVENSLSDEALLQEVLTNVQGFNPNDSKILYTRLFRRHIKLILFKHKSTDYILVYFTHTGHTKIHNI